MARTYSNMHPLGSKAYDFKLLDSISKKYLHLKDLKGDYGTVILFICNHCPFVIHINHKIVELSNKYVDHGVKFIAISSNDVLKYPQDGPIQMKKNAEKYNYNFPYLYDKTQLIAKKYDAACTPDIYLFDDKLKLIYRGQLDNSRPENGIDITGYDLSNAIDCLIKNIKNEEIQKPSIGCNIKWKN